MEGGTKISHPPERSRVKPVKNFNPRTILVFKTNKCKLARKDDVNCLDKTPSTELMCSFYDKNICPIGIDMSFSLC